MDLRPGTYGDMTTCWPSSLSRWKDHSHQRLGTGGGLTVAELDSVKDFLASVDSWIRIIFDRLFVVRGTHPDTPGYLV